MQDAIDLVQKFGFPIVMAVGMGYYIYYIWKYVTEQITPKLDESHINLIKVIDQIRMLDNDLIRLQQKVNVVLEYEKLRNTSRSGDTDGSKPGSRRPDDIQVQKSELQRNKSIKPLLDNRKSGNEPKEGDSRKTRS
tara:strand:- start:338 stop:745 length:408 start_codon:yes stop_codon:yes gene_type:complete